MTYSLAFRVGLLASVVATATLPAFGQPSPGPGPTRGQLLYDTHCIECHSVQIHWRDTHEAQDWDSLVKWVTHWQATLDLNWTAGDITAVARHLNENIYGFPMPSDQARQ
ncbi:MAG: cytochrome C [Ramlibacter sp.]